jgi:glycosyltransferase involved in cell wall biosynthesis
MEGPLINILIRTTKGRETELSKCLLSVMKQTYQNKYIIVCTDDPNTKEFWKDKYGEIFHIKPTGVPFHWNFYCNNLKERVTDGWFFYLDDDDWLHSPTVLEDIAPHLSDPNEGVICQFNRGVHPKPVYEWGEQIRANDRLEGYPEFNPQTWGAWYIKPAAIVRGKIGGSCIFLHHSQKDIANWDGERAADYRFIKAVSEKIPLKFVQKVVVQAGNKGRRGK